MTRRRKAYESRDVAQAAARMVRGLVNRASTGDQEALYELARLQVVVKRAVDEAGARMHVEAGYDYTALGVELGITRQAARQRFAPIVAKLREDTMQ